MNASHWIFQQQKKWMLVADFFKKKVNTSRGFFQKMGRQVFLCGQELARQLGRAHGVLWVPTGDQEDNLYHQPYREPERENKEVHQEQTFLPHRRCRNEIRIFGSARGHQEMVNAHQELGHYPESVPDDLWKKGQTLKKSNPCYFKLTHLAG